MQGRRDIEQADDGGEIGAIARDHLADQSEAPQQDKGKNTKPGEDQPSQQRAAITEGIQISTRWHPAPDT